MRSKTPTSKGRKRPPAGGAPRASGSAYETAFRTSPMPMAISDVASGRLIDANDTFCVVTGFAREDLIGRSSTEVNLVSEESRARMVAALQERRGFVRDLEIEYALKGGRTGTGLASAAVVEIEGRPCVIAQIVDITDRTRIAQALKESEERFREFANNLPETVFEADGTGRLTFVNRAALTMFRYTEEEVLAGLNVAETVVPEDRARAIENARARMKGEPGGYHEYTALRKDGTTFPCVILTKPAVRGGAPVGFRGLLIDITERKRIEEALRDSEERFKSVFERTTLGMAISDEGYRFVAVNPAMCRMLGYTEDEMRARTFREITHPDHLGEDRAQVERLGRGEIDCYRTEKRYLRRDGSTVWGSLSLSLLRDPDRGALRHLILVEDITERKKVEEQIRALTTRVAEIAENERQRIARELHDDAAQNLTALGLTLGALRSALPAGTDPRLDGRLEDSIKLVAQTTERLRGIIEDLRPPMLDDLGLVASIRWHVNNFTKRTGIRVVATLDEDTALQPGPEAATHVFRIVQEALINVARHARAGRVFLSVAGDAGGLHVVVADDGAGFDPAACIGTPERPCWGIINMRERAAMAGGTFELHSEPGRGTRVEVRVPVKG